MGVDLSTLRSSLPEHDLQFLAGFPVVLHCHHFNLFLDQTIDDALGIEKGQQLRFAAARECAHPVLAAAAEQTGATTPAERLELARELFRYMGHGSLDVLAEKSGTGSATGEYLHYGFAWKEKYGQMVKRNDPADAFAAGFAAAAAEVAYSLPPASIVAEETECLAMRHPACSFALRPDGDSKPTRPAVGEADCKATIGKPITGQHEEQVARIAAGLTSLAGAAHGDERGLMEMFGVYVTLHLASYYNQISCDARQHMEENNPQLLEVFGDLLRESGHVCVFNTFGGILVSPEWEGMVGKPSGDPEQILVGCCAIARALGFGHWCPGELDGSKWSLRTPSSYEACYSLTRHGEKPSSCEYFFQGAALAIMQLAHNVDWSAPEFTQDKYRELFKGNLRWTVTVESALSMGDEVSEVTVNKV
jgi:hypothetical protein